MIGHSFFIVVEMKKSNICAFLRKQGIVKQVVRMFLHKRKAMFVGLFVLPLTSAGVGMNLYIDNSINDFTQSPQIYNDTVINLDEHIHVQFHDEINDVLSYERAVMVNPPENLTFMWAEDHRSVNIAPKTIWESDTTYSIAFPYNNGNSGDGLSRIYSFKTAQYPIIISETFPQANSRYVQKNEEIVLTFDRSLEDYEIQAAVRPDVVVEQYVDHATHSLHMRVVDDVVQSAEEYHVTIFAKYHDPGSVRFFPIGSTRFDTLLPVPDVWPKSFDERLNIAQKSTRPQITKGKYIDINLEGQVTTLFDDGKFIANFLNSPGAKETPTPKGSFQIYNKDPYALSNMFQVYLPFWMAFTENGEYGFHDLIVWPEGHEDMPEGGKESTASIGNAVSPGCVRHDAKNSKYIYDWADVGTPVIIY